jgi:hypothetical protein
MAPLQRQNSKTSPLANRYLVSLRPTIRASLAYSVRNKPKMKNRRRVLSDDKQRGKILVPPFTHMMGPLREVSWINTIFPELLWIALIHNSHGDRKAVEIITQFSRLARNIKPNSTSKWFAATSDYASLSIADFEQLRFALQQQEILTAILAPLKPLISWYPECPFTLLFPRASRTSRKNTLAPLREVIASLYKRSERGPMPTTLGPLGARAPQL